MNAKDYAPLSTQLGGIANDSPSSVSTVTVNAVQSCKDITNFSIFNALNAIEGSWGQYKDQLISVTYLGKICIWRMLSSGTKTFEIPVCKTNDYMATLLTEDSCRGMIVRQGLQQLTVTMPSNTAWQITGCFTIISKD